MPMTVQQAIQALTTDPKPFMRENYLTIGGSGPTGTSNWAVFKMSLSAGQTAIGRSTKLRRRVTRRVWRADFQRITDPTAPGTLAPDEFIVYYCAMRQVGDGVGTTHTTLPATATVMLTSALSGCTFGHGSTGTGQTIVSHIQPPGGSTTRALATGAVTTRLTSLGATTDQGYVTRGHGMTADGSGAVVGIKRHGHWKFYCQSQDFTTGRVLSGLSKL
jgi:hypothetical protein